MKKLIAAILSTVLVISCTGLSVWADAIENNPPGNTIETINAGDWMHENRGTVSTNYGEVSSNYGTVTTNDGTVVSNYGTVGDNYNTVTTNQTNGTVVSNYGTVVSNYGTVVSNYGTVGDNYNTVTTNQTNGTVVSNYGTVVSNYGTVTNVNLGTVENNYGGTVTGVRGADNNFYEIIVPDGVVLSGDIAEAPEGSGRQWVEEGHIFIVTAMEGYSFTAAPTFSNATVTVEQEGKSYSIHPSADRDVTQAFDLTDFILPTEQPDPAPDPDPKPEPKPDPKPEAKSDNKPSPSAAEDEPRPDPADKKATEMYDFWQNVKRKIKNTEEGKTLRVAVPAEYIYMPASVMETLRLNPQVGLKLSWGKNTVMIKAGTAQPKQKLKVYWTKKQLTELYCK